MFEKIHLDCLLNIFISYLLFHWYTCLQPVSASFLLQPLRQHWAIKARVKKVPGCLLYINLIHHSHNGKYCQCASHLLLDIIRNTMFMLDAVCFIWLVVGYHTVLWWSFKTCIPSSPHFECSSPGMVLFIWCKQTYYNLNLMSLLVAEGA